MTIILPVFAEYYAFIDAIIEAERLFLKGNAAASELSGIEKILSSYPDAELMANGSGYGPRLDAVREQLKKASETLKAALSDYIHVPSIKLYVAKQRTLHGETWPYTHEKLQSQGSRM